MENSDPIAKYFGGYGGIAQSSGNSLGRATGSGGYYEDELRRQYNAAAIQRTEYQMQLRGLLRQAQVEPKRKVKASFKCELQREVDEWLKGVLK